VRTSSCFAPAMTRTLIYIDCSIPSASLVRLMIRTAYASGPVFCKKLECFRHEA
jgi:hypothetical protein